MMKFTVADMTCGHCVSVITKAILQLQDDAKVEASKIAQWQEEKRGKEHSVGECDVGWQNTLDALTGNEVNG